MEPFNADELTMGPEPDTKGRTLDVGPVRLVFENRESLRARLASLASRGNAEGLLAKVNPNLPTQQEIGVTVWPREDSSILGKLAAAKSGLRLWIGPKGKLDAGHVDLGTDANFRYAKFKFAPNEVDLFRAIGIEQIYLSVELPGTWKRVQMPENMRRLVAREMRHPLDKKELAIP